MSEQPEDRPQDRRVGFYAYETGGYGPLEAVYRPDYGQFTGHADYYRGRQGKLVMLLPVGNGFAVYMPLPWLHGRPWNNHALAWVLALKPTCVRVIADAATLDAMPGRVTVWLEVDDRTISKIEHEVSIPLLGAQNGHDILQQVAYATRHGSMDGYTYQPATAIANIAALDRVKFDEVKDEQK